jgi:hypothetical protein
MTEREQLIQTLVASRRLGLAPLWVALLPRRWWTARGLREFSLAEHPKSAVKVRPRIDGPKTLCGAVLLELPLVWEGYFG